MIGKGLPDINTTYPYAYRSDSQPLPFVHDKRNPRAHAAGPEPSLPQLPRNEEDAAWIVGNQNRIHPMWDRSRVNGMFKGVYDPFSHLWATVLPSRSGRHAPGVKITPHAFGRYRRLLITNGCREY